MVRSATAATAQRAATSSAGFEMLLLGVASLLFWALFLCFCFFGMVFYAAILDREQSR